MKILRKDLGIHTHLLRMVGVKYINSRVSGRQGLKLAETLPQVDLILLDIQVPRVRLLPWHIFCFKYAHSEKEEYYAERTANGRGDC